MAEEQRARSTRSPARPPPATSGTASTNSTRRCRAGGCGCSTSTIVWAIGYWVVYPAWPLLTSFDARCLRLAFAQRRCRPTSTALKAQRGPMMDKLAGASLATDRGRSAAARFRPRARPQPLSPTIARLVTAPAAAAPRAIPTSTTTTGCGAASSPTSSTRSRHGARSGDDKGHQGNMPRVRRDGMLKPDEIAAVADFVRSLSGSADRNGRRSRARQESVRRQLRGLSWAGRQGQPRIWARPT